MGRLFLLLRMLLLRLLHKLPCYMFSSYIVLACSWFLLFIYFNNCLDFS